MDLDSVEPQEKHFVDEHLQKSIADIVVKVKKNNKDAYLYFVVELKSSPEKLTALQVFTYCLYAMAYYADTTKEKPLPAVLPMILNSAVKTCCERHKHLI